MTKDETIKHLRSSLVDIQYFLAGIPNARSWMDPSSIYRQITPDRCAPYVPAREDAFLSQLHQIVMILRGRKKKSPWSPERPLQFLEVGCGIGVKLMLAMHKFNSEKIPFILSGVEKDKSYLETARQILPEDVVLHNEDALLFSRYGDYDIIYFWNPIMDGVKEAALERKILEDCKAGCVVWSFGTPNWTPPMIDGFQVYKKKPLSRDDERFAALHSGSANVPILRKKVSCG